MATSWGRKSEAWKALEGNRSNELSPEERAIGELSELSAKKEDALLLAQRAFVDQTDALISFAQREGLDLDYLRSEAADLDGTRDSAATTRPYGPLRNRPFKLHAETGVFNGFVSVFANPENAAIANRSDYAARTLQGHYEALRQLMESGKLRDPMPVEMTEYRALREESPSRISRLNRATASGLSVGSSAPGALGLFETIFERVTEDAFAKMMEDHEALRKDQARAGSRGASAEENADIAKAVERRIAVERAAFDYMSERALSKLEAPLGAKFGFKPTPMPVMPAEMRDIFLAELNKIPENEAVIHPTLDKAANTELLNHLGNHARAQVVMDRAARQAAEVENRLSSRVDILRETRAEQAAAAKAAAASESQVVYLTTPNPLSPSEAISPEPLASEQAPKLPEQWAAEPVEPGGGFVLRERGQLIDKGEGVYPHATGQAEQMSYFVTLLGVDGAKVTHWGKGLEDATKNANEGDWIELAQTAAKPGATGTPFGGRRIWSLTVFENAATSATAAAVASDAGRAPEAVAIAVAPIDAAQSSALADSREFGIEPGAQAERADPGLGALSAAAPTAQPDAFAGGAALSTGDGPAEPAEALSVDGSQSFADRLAARRETTVQERAESEGLQSFAGRLAARRSVADTALPVEEGGEGESAGEAALDMADAQALPGASLESVQTMAIDEDSAARLVPGRASRLDDIVAAAAEANLAAKKADEPVESSVTPVSAASTAAPASPSASALLGVENFVERGDAEQSVKDAAAVARESGETLAVGSQPTTDANPAQAPKAVRARTVDLDRGESAAGMVPGRASHLDNVVEAAAQANQAAKALEVSTPSHPAPTPWGVGGLANADAHPARALARPLPVAGMSASDAAPNETLAATANEAVAAHASQPDIAANAAAAAPISRAAPTPVASTAGDAQASTGDSTPLTADPAETGAEFGAFMRAEAELSAPAESVSRPASPAHAAAAIDNSAHDDQTRRIEPVANEPTVARQSDGVDQTAQASEGEPEVTLGMKRGLTRHGGISALAAGVAALENDPEATPADRALARAAAKGLSPTQARFDERKSEQGERVRVQIDAGVESFATTEKAIEQHVAGFNSAEAGARAALTPQAINRLAADNPVVKQILKDRSLDRWRASQPGAARTTASHMSAGSDSFADQTTERRAAGLAKMDGFDQRLSAMRGEQTSQTLEENERAAPRRKGPTQ